MPFTDYLDQALVTMVFSNTPFTVPSTLYVALSTTNPLQAKGSSTPFWNFTEPSGNSYSRVAVTNNTSNWSAVGSQPSNGYQQQNATAVSFPQATGAWGTIVAFGIWDAPTGGNLLGYGSLNVAQTITTGDTSSFGIGNITITAN